MEEIGHVVLKLGYFIDFLGEKVYFSDIKKHKKMGVRYMEQLLIVEDDIGLNRGLCKALKEDARQIISCQDLKTAKEQLLCGGVSLILLDINLPDGSGLELLREIKENMPGIPVILLTANDTDLDIVDGLERGADDYITKPFSLSVLRARVNTQLRKQASSHKNAPICIGPMSRFSTS